MVETIHGTFSASFMFKEEFRVGVNKLSLGLTVFMLYLIFLRVSFGSEN